MEKVSTFIRIVMSLLVTLLLFSTVVPSPYAATRGPYASIEVSKTADVSGSTIFGSITITCTSKIAARITSIVDWLEVHYPKERRWKKVADVPLAVGLPVTLDPGATMTLVYSYGVTDTYEGANSMRNVVSVQLANSNHKGTNAPYVTRSESFKPPAPSPSKDLIVYWHEGGKTVYVNGTQVTNGSTIPFQRNEVANITAVPDAHYDYYTVRINATDDVTLNSWDPDINYDKYPFRYPNNVWWQSDGEHRTVLEFDLSSIPKFKRHNATFSMYLDDDGDRSQEVFVDRLTASFIADEATWNNRTSELLWDTAGGDFTTDGEVSTTAPASSDPDVWLTWNITDILLDESGDTLYLIVRCKYDRRKNWARDKLTFVNTEGEWDVNGIEPEHSDYKPYINLTYKEPHDYAFDKYVYDSGETTDNPFYLTMDSDYEVHAYFVTAVKLKVYYHIGISTLYVNGTSVTNGTEIRFVVNHVANITSVPSTGYSFDKYTYNGNEIKLNPFYLTMDDYYEVHAYA